jgi:hypothetical protein
LSAASSTACHARRSASRRADRRDVEDAAAADSGISLASSAGARWKCMPRTVPPRRCDRKVRLHEAQIGANRQPCLPRNAGGSGCTRIATRAAAFDLPETGDRRRVKLHAACAPRAPAPPRRGQRRGHPRCSDRCRARWLISPTSCWRRYQRAVRSRVVSASQTGRQPSRQ